MWEEEEGVKEARVKAGKLRAGRLDTESMKEGDGFGRSLFAYKGLFTMGAIENKLQHQKPFPRN